MSEQPLITFYNAVDTPYPHRVRLALEEAGIKYNMIWIDLAAKPDWYPKKVNPIGKVPYLVYGGEPVGEGEAPSPSSFQMPESLVINEFLADAFPSAKLLPADPILRAKARLFIRRVDEEFTKGFFQWWFMGGTVEGILALVETFQALLPPEGYAVGEWSIADAAFVPFVLRLYVATEKRVGFWAEGLPERAMEALNGPKFARIRKYLEDNMARPSMTKTWDEAAALAMVGRRMQLMMKTGMINAEIPLKLPPQ